MKVLQHNSASILYAKVKSLGQEKPDSWRCIHLAFSTQNHRPNHRPNHLQHIGRITADLLADDDGYIYLCDDGDVFILFKGALLPVLRKLADHFEDFRPERIHSPRGQNGLITVFDLGQSWHAFFELCRNRAYGLQSGAFRHESMRIMPLHP